MGKKIIIAIVSIIFIIIILRVVAISGAIALVGKEYAPIIVKSDIINSTYIRNNLLQAFKISSSSMSPALIKGDRVLINKVIYKKSLPERGDLLVFNSPRSPEPKPWISRILGLPNETLEIRNGRILINGVAIAEPAVLTYYNAGEFGQEGKVVIIPADNYYVLGDNSTSSRDSRFLGFVTKDNIIGKAIFRYFPFNRMGKLTD